MSTVTPVRRATSWVRDRAAVLTKFGVVGALGVVINLGVFNLLRAGPLGVDVAVFGNYDRVVTAKVIATVVSVAFAWVAHRGWTFKDRRRHRPTKELLLFGAVNAVALVLEAGTVAITHHGLGWTSWLADNLSTLVGIGLGTIARYAGFTRFVFASDPASSTDAEGSEQAPSAP
ncbi:GtrA family protein [Demequina lutea]|uniref:Putative flippase GtrA n=1 Tax=Demequina lutea TaxID=431489 RepID=A0A7Y9Z8H1_9MICO|nr:GtrA family protein [Demequina lutea]NYI40779.1 putative flippase GtrA [Demequina lutea]